MSLRSRFDKLKAEIYKNKRRTVGIAILTAVVMAAILTAIFSTTSSSKNTTHLTTSEDFIRTHTHTFFEAGDFNRGLSTTNLFTLDTPIYGGIIPHHLIPSTALNTYFSQLKKQNPKRIILISPNHFLQGTTPFMTSPYGYNTPFGTVHIDPDLYHEIADTNHAISISRSDSGMDNEHGIGNLTAYIKYYLPDTTIMPVSLWPNTSPEQIDAFIKIIAPLISTDTIFLASIDFSHYLPAQVAEEKDKLTWRLMSEKNYAAVLKLNNNDYLDTPPSLVTMLKTMDTIGARNMHQLYHSNSGFIMQNLSMPTTSYFFLSFTK